MTRASKWRTAGFVAWDGEGVTVRHRHRYIMLRNSEGGGLTDARGLTTRAGLTTLVNGLLRRPHDWHVGFAFGYDVNMLLGDLSPVHLAQVHAGHWCQWGQFRFRYRRAKSFTLQRHDAHGGWQGGTVWDTFGFFQSSFVTACEKYGVGSPHVREAVASMKAARSQFQAEDVRAIQEYCEEECRLLVQLMLTLKDYLDDADLSLTRWDGAGAVASSLLRREGVKAHKSVTVPEPVLDALQGAFAGGRIELVQYGHAPNRLLYHYDVHSAYPTALTEVPTLAHGGWLQTSGIGRVVVQPFGVYRVLWKLPSQPFYPFVWRAPDGRIFFPREGQGWCWGVELAAALRWAARRGGRITVLEGFAWHPDRAQRPFHFVRRLYDQRRRWKAEGRGAEKVVKLGLNSLYGKCAQHVGGQHDAPPPWHELAWAGYTTARTRALLYTVAMQQPHAIVGFATDALFAQEPLEVVLGDALGSWSASQHLGSTFVQSGVYWLDDAEGSTGFHRGFDPGSLDRRAIVRAWAEGRDRVRARSTRFIGMGQALAGGTKAWRRWRQWQEVPRELQLTPGGTKRMNYPTIPGAFYDASQGFIRTVAYDPILEGPMGMSTPAALPWRALAGALPFGEELEAEEAVL